MEIKEKSFKTILKYNFFVSYFYLVEWDILYFRTLVTAFDNSPTLLTFGKADFKNKDLEHGPFLTIDNIFLMFCYTISTSKLYVFVDCYLNYLNKDIRI